MARTLEQKPPPARAFAKPVATSACCRTSTSPTTTTSTAAMPRPSKCWSPGQTPRWPLHRTNPHPHPKPADRQQQLPKAQTTCSPSGSKPCKRAATGSPINTRCLPWWATHRGRPIQGRAHGRGGSIKATARGACCGAGGQGQTVLDMSNPIQWPFQFDSHPMSSKPHRFFA